MNNNFVTTNVNGCEIPSIPVFDMKRFQDQIGEFRRKTDGSLTQLKDSVVNLTLPDVGK